MFKRLILPLALITLLLSCCMTTVQDSPQAFPADIATEIQTTMDDLTQASSRPA